MKSAYELAMERLREEDPEGGISLNDEQKKTLAEIDSSYTAKIAEREIFLRGKLQEAVSNHDMESFTQLETQLRNEKLRLEEERESKKNKIRSQST